jgi:hypothetical protein
MLDVAKEKEKAHNFRCGLSDFWCGWQELNPRPLGS